jgi:hypothetical protein
MLCGQVKRYRTRKAEEAVPLRILPTPFWGSCAWTPNWTAMAFGESLPFISWAAQVGIVAVVAAADPLIFSTIVAAAAIGAALGDWLSYWIGRSPICFQRSCGLSSCFRRVWGA